MTRGTNNRGPIASSYDELQAIDLLIKARASYASPPHSRASTVRTTLQAFELVLLNLSDLTDRMSVDLEQGRIAVASVKASWRLAFNRLGTHLSFVAVQAAAAPSKDPGRSVGFTESPALQGYVSSLRRLDTVLSGLLSTQPARVREAVAASSSDDELVRLLHHFSLSCHEGTVWESALAELTLPRELPDYATFIDSRGLKAAIESMRIEGDTYLMQFRCLHQVPEILSFEANDHLAAAIRVLREGAGEQALYHVAAASDLVAGIVAAMTTLVDSLVLADYHDIRENLGVTSGSHSVSLRYHLGRDLYSQLSEALVTAMAARPKSTADALDLPGADRCDATWLALLREALRLRSLLKQWRRWHIHLPRSNLGAEMTRSLSGSPDAIHTVTMMRDEAEREDGLAGFARAFGVAVDNAAPGPLSAYLRSEQSVDRQILALRGRITRDRFPEVQNRSGYFAAPARFAIPPKRCV